MTDETWMPNIDTLVAELKRVREKGLGELRRLKLPELTQVATVINPGHPSIKETIRSAVDRLGGQTRDAAEYDFGLVEGTELWQSSERRARAAEIYGITAETFRKRPEKLIIEQIALAMQELAAEAAHETKNYQENGDDQAENPLTTVSGGLGSKDNPLKVEITKQPFAESQEVRESRFRRTLRLHRIEVIVGIIGAVAILIAAFVPVVYEIFWGAGDETQHGSGDRESIFEVVSITGGAEIESASTDPQLSKYTLVFRSSDGGTFHTNSLSGDAEIETIIPRYVNAAADKYAFSSGSMFRHEENGLVASSLFNGAGRVLTEPPPPDNRDAETSDQESGEIAVMLWDESPSYASAIERVFFLRATTQPDGSSSRELYSIGIDGEKSTERQEETPVQFSNISVDSRGIMVSGTCQVPTSARWTACWTDLSTGKWGEINLPSEYGFNLGVHPNSVPMSPDGKWIALSASERTGSRSSYLYLYNIEKDEWRKVVHLEAGLYCSISWANGTPDAQYIVFNQNVRNDRLNSIYVYRLSDGVVLKSEVLGDSPYLTKF